LGLWLQQRAAAQGFSQAPLVPAEAETDPEHPFWRDLRNEFPIEPDHIHFDPVASGTPPFQALDALQAAQRQAAGTGSSLDASWTQALRQRLADFLKAAVQGILVAADDSTAMLRVADALPLPRGTRVVLSTHDAPRSLAPWVSLAREGRIEIRMVDFGGDSRTVVQRVRDALDSHGVLVTPHVLPTTGMLLPIEELRDLVRRRRGHIVVQGSQAVGMQQVDLEQLGVDAYVAATHGWLLGPVGVAFAAVDPGLLPALTPRPALLDVRTPQYVVQRRVEVQNMGELETGAINPGLSAATVASIDWIDAFGVEAAHRYATNLSRVLHKELSSLRGIEVLTTASDAAAMPIVALRVARRPNTQVADWLLEQVGMRVHRLDNDNINAVRVSLGLRNQLSEVRYLVRAAEALA
jgi:selenocysteine lyase/cysteine desulfurase